MTAVLPQSATADIPLSGPDDTEAAARRLAPLLGPGDCVLLSGQLGTGKTHFARALIQHRLAVAGLWEDVPSPTFTLVQTYDDGICEMWHADLYRLTSADELIELGLDQAFVRAITLIEWPDRLGPDAPPNALRLTFATDGAGRRLTAEWPDPRLAQFAGPHV